jgi:hypothetical protein
MSITWRIVLWGNASTMLHHAALFLPVEPSDTRQLEQYGAGLLNVQQLLPINIIVEL